MKKFLLWLLIILAVLIAAVVAVAMTKPDTYTVQGSVTINAKPEKIFAVINDMNNWTQWSPWEAMDPAMQRRVVGDAAGKGQAYEWDGKRAGKGRITIVESVPPSKVIMKNEWLAPMQAYNMNEYTIVPSGKATVVTWTMTGPSSFTQKIFQVFVDMQKAMKGSFDAGLAKLKAVSEK